MSQQIILSQHIAQQARGIREEKSVATKEFPVVTEIVKDSKKSCHERENSVATRKIMLRQTSEGQGYEKLVVNRFGVTTQGIPVVTRTRLLNKIYVATLSKYVATQSKSKPREQVVTKNKKLQQRQRQRLKSLL